MADISDLIARVETGEGADRALEGRVHNALASEDHKALVAIALALHGAETEDEWFARMADEWGVPPLLSSLDAVMALVPANYLASVRELWDNATKSADAVVWTYRVDSEGRRFWLPDYSSLNTSPARALLAAILRAKAGGA